MAKVDSEPRPIIGTSGTGGGFDLNKLLEQQRLHQQQQAQQAVVLPPHLSTPMARPLGAGPAPPPPFMPIAPGPIPMQAATQASMQNAMIMQQINRGEGTGFLCGAGVSSVFFLCVCPELSVCSVTGSERTGCARYLQSPVDPYNLPAWFI